MDKKNILEPELRFGEFSGEWEENKVLIRIISGNTYPLKSYSKKGTLLIQGLNIYPGKLDLDNPIYISNSFKSKKNVLIKEYDILIGLNRPIINKQLKVCIFLSKEKAFLYQRAGILRFNKEELTSLFLYQYLTSNKFLKQLSLELVGSDQPYIKSNLFIKTKNIFPELPEQEKIASFLSSVDKKIENLSKKKDLLTDYKKGMMQKIFSQEIRFKDDGKDFPEWVEKKLGDYIIEYKLGGNYSNTLVKSKYPLIKMGNINRGRITLNKLEYIRKGEEINQNDEIQFGDLFFNTRNTLELVGKVAIWRNELPLAYYNSNLMRMKFKNNFFMNYRFNSFSGIKALRRIATGITSVAAIYTKDLIKIKLFIPSLPEQEKIASFLSAIDKKIELTSKELEKMKEFKKGLLQKMFV